MKSNLVDIEVKVHHETEKAWLLSTTGNNDDAVWVPKSQAQLDGDTLTCPEWLATDKGFV